jgi:hypothetical protein
VILARTDTADWCPARRIARREAFIGVDYNLIFPAFDPLAFFFRVLFRPFRHGKLLGSNTITIGHCEKFHFALQSGNLAGTRLQIGDKFPVFRAFIGFVLDTQDVRRMDCRQHAAAIL